MHTLRSVKSQFRSPNSQLIPNGQAPKQKLRVEHWELIGSWELRSWELSWARLQTQGDGVRKFLEHAIAHGRERPSQFEAGRVLVPAAAVPRRDRADVDVVFRAHAHVDVAVGPELEEDDCLDFPRRERQVDQPFG